MQLIAETNYGITPGSIEDRAVGCLVGLAVGDALGAPVEFKKRGIFEPVTGMRAGGPFNLQAGEWTDDTSMALALGEALLANPYLVSRCVVMDRWVSWYKRGEFSHNGRCFDIGVQTSIALDRWVRGEGGNAPRTKSAGNGCIMRLAPVAVMHHADPAEAAHLANRQALLTHNNPECLYYAMCMAKALAKGIEGGVWKMLDGIDTFYQCRRIEDVKSTGYVKDTYEAACWSMVHGGSFEKSVLKAVNLGDDADTIGAVTGQFAGAAYGLSAIPRDWLEVLAWRDEIIDLGRKLFAHCQ